MIETYTSRQVKEAIENAHKERALALRSIFRAFFGSREDAPAIRTAHHA